MSLKGSWLNNDARERWEAVIGRWHAVAQFDRLSMHYDAYIESAEAPEEVTTDHYAPHAFSDPEAATAWCEDEIERLEKERHPR